MALAARSWFSYAEYVELEERSDVKHEFLDGQVWAMAGGSPEHAGIASSVTALLVAQLRGRACRVFSSDLRIRVEASGLGTYPDVSVICGKMQLDAADERGHSAVNPTVLVEVLSPSTEAYDRGEKLAHYKQIASLREVVFVAHDRREVEVVRREPDGSWSRHVASSGTSATLTSLQCSLSVDEVYSDPLA